MIVGFLGSGNMARAMARGWHAAGIGEMLFTDAGSGRAARTAAEVGGRAVAGGAELAREADLVVLACKPKDLEGAAESARGAPVVLSLLGATPLELVRKAFPGSTVLRAMPNLPVEARAGMICLSGAGDATPSQGAAEPDEVRKLLGLLGEVVELADADMDAATAVSGCSPAYVDLLVDALSGAGARAGLEPDLARRLAIGAVEGTVPLLRARAPGQLRAEVASPGGSTEAGLEALESSGFEGIAAEAVRASLLRMGAEPDRAADAEPEADR